MKISTVPVSTKRWPLSFGKLKIELSTCSQINISILLRLLFFFFLILANCSKVFLFILNRDVIITVVKDCKIMTFAWFSVLCLGLMALDHAWRDLYCATLAVTWGLSFCCLIRRTAPFCCLLRQARGAKNLNFNPYLDCMDQIITTAVFESRLI